MPLYEYNCPECGKETTEFRRLDDRDSVYPCGCGGELLRQRSTPSRVWAPTRDVR